MTASAMPPAVAAALADLDARELREALWEFATIVEDAVGCAPGALDVVTLGAIATVVARRATPVRFVGDPTPREGDCNAPTDDAIPHFCMRKPLHLGRCGWENMHGEVVYFGPAHRVEGREVMRLLVCGSRLWTDYVRMREELRAFEPDAVIHGMARGADMVADEEARSYFRSCGVLPNILGFRAEWASDGKAAGPNRNARMLVDGKPTQALAFGPLWRSDEPGRVTGTGDMVRRCLRAGVPVRWVAAPDLSAVDLAAFPVRP